MCLHPENSYFVPNILTKLTESEDFKKNEIMNEFNNTMKICAHCFFQFRGVH